MHWQDVQRARLHYMTHVQQPSCSDDTDHLTPGNTSPDGILAAIRQRRTHKSFSGAAIDRDLVESLVQAALWAPQHRLTNPWRFAMLDQPAIASLGSWLPQQSHIVNDPEPGPKAQRKMDKLTQHYFPQLGAIVMLVCQPHDETVNLTRRPTTPRRLRCLLCGRAKPAPRSGGTWFSAFLE